MRGEVFGVAVEVESMAEENGRVKGKVKGDGCRLKVEDEKKKRGERLRFFLLS